MTSIYHRYRVTKLVCVLLAVWMCALMLSYSSQYNQWVSSFQILVTNVSQKGEDPATDRSFLVTHVSQKGEDPATDRSFLVTHESETRADQTSNRSLLVTNSSVLLLKGVQVHHINTNDTQKKNFDHQLQPDNVKSTEACTFPYIDPLDPAIMALAKVHPAISCQQGTPNLVYVDGDKIKVNYSKMAYFENKNQTFKECRFNSLGRKPLSDSKTIVLNTSKWFNDSIDLSSDDDNLVVECFDNKKVLLSRSYFTLVRPKEDLEILLEDNLKKHIAKNAPKEVLSVLFIGIDGNSKQNFQRLMPKTRNFLLDNLTAIELHKYNTVGGATFPTVVPLLTGLHAPELEKHNNWTSKEYLDVINDLFLWSDFHKAGYRTGMMLDHTYITAFHYLKKGWNESPVDYYVRAALLEMERDKLMRGNGSSCVGDIPEITLNHDLWIQLASTFNNSQRKPYFGYSFSADLTHDDLNLASAGDDLYLAFLQEMVNKNIINNTLIVFFSDHGERYGKIRLTYNGFIESRTPYVFLVFPSWFYKKYPEIHKVLKINQERLTTNFDLYETVRDVLNFQAVTGYGDVKKRGISLFKEIPPERTCEHADIPTIYCVCNALTPANISSDLSQALATAVLDKLYRFIYNVRDKCTQLSLKSVQNVMVSQSGGEHSQSAANKKTFYQIMLTTTPGEALYEAKLAYNASSNVAVVVGDVSRLNMYRGQAECVNDSTLRQFCFCKT
ncbi:hypothetical protein BsWGS_22096 [Bradybaena similaris]